MKKTAKMLTAVLLTVLLGVFAAFPASAAEQTVSPSEQTVEVQQAVVEAADSLQLRRITRLIRLSDDDVDSISGRLSEDADVYLVELSDGRCTYFITVDLRTDDAAYLRNLRVMRKTSHKLYDRSAAMAAEETDRTPVLMDYTHIVGELGAHYIVYRVTDIFGGASLKGTFGDLYRRSSVAELNINEQRMATLIRLLGLMIGE